MLAILAIGVRLERILNPVQPIVAADKLNLVRLVPAVLNCSRWHFLVQQIVVLFGVADLPQLALVDLVDKGIVQPADLVRRYGVGLVVGRREVQNDFEEFVENVLDVFGKMFLHLAQVVVNALHLHLPRYIPANASSLLSACCTHLSSSSRSS